MKRFAVGLMLSLVVLSGRLLAQDAETFSRKNTFTVFAENANTSSHIVVGATRQRKMVDLGFAYSRRVAQFWGSDLSYHIEMRPVLFESDPLTISNYSATINYSTGPEIFTGSSTSVNYSKCTPASGSYVIPPYSSFPGETVNYTITCGRQWTFGQAFSPFGFKYALRTRHPLQPYLVGTLGYMYTSRAVPLADASPFNFLINIGAGVELYRKGKRSIAVEGRISHFSNRDTANENPGTDQFFTQVSYSFGR